jgi:hypothetical protein
MLDDIRLGGGIEVFLGCLEKNQIENSLDFDLFHFPKKNHK